MAILDSAFPGSPDFHDFTEEKLQDDIKNFILSPTKIIPQEIYDYVSPLRKMLFEWYPFKKDCRILEIGGNVGELTEFFCQKGRSVFSIEINEARREIMRLRCKKYGNLNVKNILFKDIPGLGTFDYIIVHNCFGYLKKYFSTSDTYVDFFRMLYDSLNAGGRILIAANNRIGLKYLSGAVEEHTGKMYSGINGFDGYNKVRTFTKAELTALFERAGIRQYKFYYPFPNYVFPTEIHTSESLKYFTYDSEDFATDYETPVLFDTKRLAQALQAEGFIEAFANSFLVELANEGLSNIIYYKPDLKKEDHTGGCTICGDKLPQAVIHFADIETNCCDLNVTYSEKEQVRFYWGDCWEVPSCSRLKEKLTYLLDSSIKEDHTENLCKEVSLFWKRIACAIRGLQQESSVCAPEGYDIRSLCCNDRIYVQTDGTICILWPSGFRDCAGYNCEYIIWALIYNWYISEIFTYKSYRAYLPIDVIYSECSIDIEAAKGFKELSDRMANGNSDEKELLSHARPKYEMGMTDPTQIFMHGEPVMTRESDIRNIDAHQKILEQEEQISKALLR